MRNRDMIFVVPTVLIGVLFGGCVGSPSFVDAKPEYVVFAESSITRLPMGERMPEDEVRLF